MVVAPAVVVVVVFTLLSWNELFVVMVTVVMVTGAAVGDLLETLIGFSVTFVETEDDVGLDFFSTCLPWSRWYVPR